MEREEALKKMKAPRLRMDKCVNAGTDHLLLILSCTVYSFDTDLFIYILARPEKNIKYKINIFYTYFQWK